MVCVQFFYLSLFWKMKQTLEGMSGAEGRCLVMRLCRACGSERVVMTTRGPGQFIGEVSLFEDHAGDAQWKTSVRARGSIKALLLTRAHLRTLLQRQPEAEAAVRAGEAFPPALRIMCKPRSNYQNEMTAPCSKRQTAIGPPDATFFVFEGLRGIVHYTRIIALECNGVAC